MDPALLLIGAVLVGAAAIAVVTTWRLDSAVRRLSADVASALLKIASQDDCSEVARENIAKLLVPIRCLADDVAELDNDLARLQTLYEQLKKRVESSPPVGS